MLAHGLMLHVVRWEKIQTSLAEHKHKLAAALEVHAFNRDIDDINDRINEKVCIRLLLRLFPSPGIAGMVMIIILPLCPPPLTQTFHISFTRVIPPSFLSYPPYLSWYWCI